jgi:hypothetical protein
VASVSNGGGEKSGSDAPSLSDAELLRARTIGVGCFATFVGFASGGMMGVLMGKVVGAARKCTPVEGLPACDWHWYAAAGMVVGALTLPVLVLRRLRRGSASGKRT